MPTQIALLRAVNLAGRAQVAMADLRDLLARLGFAEPRSLLQSGNLVFRSGPISRTGLERLLEAETEKRLGLRTDVLVRTAAQWQAVVAGNPFRREAERDPSHLLVMSLKEAADPERVALLQAAIAGPEVVRATGRQLYAVYPNGIGRSRLTTSLIEKKLGTRCTGRNWNTVLKLWALAKP